ncbi:DUF2066 domain-containing protein [Proteobacteria bacterium 005FR1]|nr:DUF2066 domain-containing protein [Proteobacteria bacterium 005FR1]
MAAVYHLFRRTALFAGLLLSLLWVPALAQQVDLYRADMLVTDQSQRERTQAAVDGLAEVVVRASGQPQVLEDPQVIEALRDASKYLVEWRYENSDEMLEINGKQVPAWRLVLRYSGNAIEKLLRDLRLPIWPANRPSMVVWLMVDDGNSRSRVSSSNRPDVLKYAQASAKRRGIPLVKPLMDLEDQVALSADALWSLDQETIERASERYSADSILVGRLTETSQGQWRAGWLLIHRGRSNVFDSTGVELQDVVATGIDQVANHFFQLYGITPSAVSSEALLLQVDGVEDFASYSRFMSYLQSLAVIRRYDLVAVRGGSVLLYVYLQGELGLLRDALALDERLLPVADLSANGLSPGNPANPLRYRWR